MGKQELLKLFEVSEEIGMPVSTIQKHVREGKLKANRNGREYLVTRVDLNRYLGIETNEDTLRRDLEIAQLKQKIQSYEMKIKMVDNFVSQVKFIVSNKGEN